MENGDGGGKNKGGKKTIEGTYKKKSQLEHILLRPDTYIGSIETVTEMMWVYDKENEKMIQREIKYVPGLYKIFDEILVNAADNKQRDAKMDTIKIDIDVENNTISVWNNGKGIPVVIHKEENMYVPTMIFGHLLTSSNYDDDEEKVTGGRNGYGAKLCNIFSNRFTVETASKKYKKSLKQTWGDNMGKSSEPRIKEYHGDDFTRVTFSPDLKKFNMEKLDKDIVDLMTRRAYDCAASAKGVKVILNGTRIPIKNFKEYCELYTRGKYDDTGMPLKIAYDSFGSRWEVALTLSDTGYKQVSFVNSIATTKGGRHVEHVTKLIIGILTDLVKKKNKKDSVPIKDHQIKQSMWIFVNCLINNPTFDSQTKENMTSQVKNFGSKCEISDKFNGLMAKIGIIESVMSFAKYKADLQLQKLGPKSKQRRLNGVPKLEDANDAGTVRSMDCTLILTEGDSAKTLAVSGVSSIKNGRDKFGIFPLRGKLLNVREATHKQILENAEINNLIKILGLQYKKKYENRDDLKTLRYGKLMIMTDQDQDGSHIKGLLINFIHHNWPGLLKLSFIEEFITPLVKAKKRDKEISFYSMAEFEEWQKEEINPKTWKIKYYKGLGTSTGAEAKDYFKDMKRHRIKFTYSGPQDDENIVMAFSKKCVDQRKDWLTNHMISTRDRKERGLGEEFLYQKNTEAISFTDFVNIELVSFSNYDNIRSIPNMMDGLKPGQRKVMYVCMQRADKHEVKVAQLVGAVAEKSAYHHGEASLMSTIINLAQNFVGSNNVNLLLPNGQFGSRAQGGKDAASARYIFTKLNPLVRLIFHPDDDALLTHEYDDNKKIEPVFYVPIIPMVLVNGADGIGTGWMTKIPNYNPRDIVNNLYRMMDGYDIIPMKPFYKNFKGTIESCGNVRYVISGEISIIGADKIEISELPIGCWTQHYKETVLEPMLQGTDKAPAIITDYKEYHGDDDVKFIVTIPRDKLIEYERDGLHKTFKLQTTITTTSMCAFDHNSCLQKYDDVQRIIREFYTVRLDYYERRKKYLKGILEAEALKLTNEARFIMEKCNNTLIVENKKKKVMIAELHDRGYDSDPVKAWIKAQKRIELNDDEEEEEGTEAEEDGDPNEHDYGYLLGLTMLSLTEEKKNELLKKKESKIAEVRALEVKTPISLWRDDLDTFIVALNEYEDKEKNSEEKVTKKGKKGDKKVEKSPRMAFKSENSRKIKAEIDDEMKKRIEKLDIASKEKKEGIVKKPKVKKETGIKEEKDEFDMMIEANSKSLDDRLGLTPNEKKVTKKGGGKQTTLPFKSIAAADVKKTKQKRKSRGSNDTDDDDDDDDYDDDNNNSDPDIDFESISPPPAPRAPRRAAAAKQKKYNLDTDESDNDKNNSDELELLSDNESKQDKPKLMSPVLEQSDSDDDFNVDKKKKSLTKPSSEELFDSLVGQTPEKTKTNKPLVISSSEDSPVKLSPSPPKKTKVINKKKAENGAGSKAAVKRQAKKQKSSDDDDDDDNSDDDDDEIFASKTKKKAKRNDSTDESFVDDSPVVKPTRKATGGRNRKPVSYQFDSEDSD